MSTTTRSRPPSRTRTKAKPAVAPAVVFSPEETAMFLRLREACAGRSLPELEILLGFHRETLRRFMLGLNRPSARFLAAVCENLNVSGDWLLLGRGPMHPGAKGQRKGR